MTERLKITIYQDDFELKLTQKAEIKGQARIATHAGARAENILVVRDVTAADMIFVGRPGREVGMELRPWVAHIQATYDRSPPNFPHHPDWAKLSECVSTLSR
mgnify:CR=1 FL=1